MFETTKTQAQTIVDEGLKDYMLKAYNFKLKAKTIISGANKISQPRADIAGALELYLDFINMFLALLRLFGDRR